MKETARNVRDFRRSSMSFYIPEGQTLICESVMVISASLKVFLQAVQCEKGLARMNKVPGGA